MSDDSLAASFRLDGMAAIITGGTGTLGAVFARGLAAAGARVGVLGRRAERADAVAHAIVESGGEAMPLAADVLNRSQLENARDAVLQRWGGIDILINAAGGNVAAASANDAHGFFDLSLDALEEVIDLNLLGTLLPCQVFGEAIARRAMVDQSSMGYGCIVNVSSMAASRALTRVVGYGAAKSGVESLTRWLAVELARLYGGRLRVNAIAPGFFVAEQNRDLLLKSDGSLTDRGQAIVNHTPAGRFGEPGDLIGPLVWLCSPAASFVNGVILPIDGGFSAFSGV